MTKLIKFKFRIVKIDLKSGIGKMVWATVLFVSVFIIVPIALEGVGLFYIVRAIINRKNEKYLRYSGIGFCCVLVAYILLNFDSVLSFLNGFLNSWDQPGTVGGL